MTPTPILERCPACGNMTTLRNPYHVLERCMLSINARKALDLASNSGRLPVTGPYGQRLAERREAFKAAVYGMTSSIPSGRGMEIVRKMVQEDKEAPR